MSSIWMQMSDEEALVIKGALSFLKDESLAVREDHLVKILENLSGRIDLLMQDREHDEDFRQAAIEKYTGKLTDGDLDFQSDGMVSKGEGGAYVMAFLHVRNDEVFPDMEEEFEP